MNKADLVDRIRGRACNISKASGDRPRSTPPWTVLPLPSKRETGSR